FVEAARERGAQVIAMSALLTTTMPGMKQTVEAVEQAGLRGQVRVMVGGAPVTQRFAEEIGADGFSDNASGAVRAVRELVKT
ncbi:MAG: cobalamin-dependent protein, partial [Chthonomonadales bacterium]|nr:cobalamin-dependent protein [Chthonomonadales bacterium]